MSINTLVSFCFANDKQELLDEWNYEKNDKISPETISYGSERKVWWKCVLGHEWESRVANRTTLGRGCPYCSGRRTLSGFNDLETWCKENGREDLIEQWNYERNTELISQISPSNNKKVWWKCLLGHEWDATVGSRTTSSRPAGCPYCSNPPKRILVGFNDLASWCEKNRMEYILQEWNYEKNMLRPREVTFGSGISVYWKCNKNHEWKTAINNRTSGKTSCPICARTQTSFPEQALAFYLMKKFDVLQRYKIKGYEVDIYIPKYNIAIEYDGRFFHDDIMTAQRDQRKSEVLSLAGVKLIRIKETENKQGVEEGVIFFSTSNGKYIAGNFEWVLNQLVIAIGEIIGVPVDIGIDISRDELDIRAHYMNVLKENSVAAVFPQLIPEWDVEKNKGVESNAFSARNNNKVWWKCKNGHSWKASIHGRTVNGLGCPFCAGQRTIVGVNDLVSWCIENGLDIMNEWDYNKNKLQPVEYQKTSNKKVWWRCSKGHEWEASVANRVHGTGCPICNTGNIIGRNKTSLLDWCKDNDYMFLIDEWNYEKNGDTPDLYTFGSHAKVWWKCKEGHEWQAVIKSRTYNHGCPYCSPSNKRVLIGVNDLCTWCREHDKEYIIDEWDYEKNGVLEPKDVTKGSHKRVWWKCKEGHQWETVVKERTKINGNRCPFCRKKSEYERIELVIECKIMLCLQFRCKKSRNHK